MKTSRIIKAMTSAIVAHKGQVRKFTNEPYIVHPFAVAGLVASVSIDTYQIAAAFLHDVVEDTDATIEMVELQHGKDVAWYVKEMTDTTTLEDGNRKVRRALDRERISHISTNGKTIKLADIIDNIKSIHLLDNGFAELYLEEKRLMLHELRDGDHTLYKIADDLLRNLYHE